VRFEIPHSQEIRLFREDCWIQTSELTAGSYSLKIRQTSSTSSDHKIQNKDEAATKIQHFVRSNSAKSLLKKNEYRRKRTQKLSSKRNSNLQNKRKTPSPPRTRNVGQHF